ncbi:MAG TPA: carboxypeptidase-like regulatory domain-containing protein [Pyrinomonadaceae bacterium]
MNSLARYLIVLVVSWSCAALPRLAECQTKSAGNPTKTVTSSVSGRITVHGKGAPGITVAMRTQNNLPSTLTQPIKAVTDGDGNYRLTAVPPGSYQVFPIAPGYVSPDYATTAGRKTLLLSENEDVQGIDFSLEPGGVITGKVTDADGRPVIEEHITLSPEGEIKGRGQMPVPGAERVLTDDRGIYRIYGVPEGRYKISAGVADDDPNFDPRGGRISYKRTYYPDVADFENAKVLEVVEGGELKNIDIVLGRSLPAFSVSGRVVDGETGRPVMGLRFMLQRTLGGNGYGVVPSFSSSNSQGEFRIDNVTPGKYTVMISQDRQSELRTDGAAFEITDQDVTGLLVKTFKGISLSGNIVVEGTSDKNVLRKLAEMRLHVYSQNEATHMGYGREALVTPDGSFRVTGLSPGNVNFYLAPGFRQTSNFSIVRIERDGVAQPRNFVPIKEGDNLGGITVVLAYGGASIRGEVKFENGPLPPNARVSVTAKKGAESDQPGYGSRAYSLDVRNRFLIDGLAAGTYELYVNVYIPGRGMIPMVKRAVNVPETGTTEVELTVDLKATPDQPR